MYVSYMQGYGMCHLCTMWVRYTIYVCGLCVIYVHYLFAQSRGLYMCVIMCLFLYATPMLMCLGQVQHMYVSVMCFIYVHHLSMSFMFVGVGQVSVKCVTYVCGLGLSIICVCCVHWLYVCVKCVNNVSSGLF